MAELEVKVEVSKRLGNVCTLACVHEICCCGKEQGVDPDG